MASNDNGWKRIGIIVALIVACVSVIGTAVAFAASKADRSEVQSQEIRLRAIEVESAVQLEWRKAVIERLDRIERKLDGKVTVP